MTPAAMTLPLAEGRLGLFVTPASQYEDAEVFSALYFKNAEACLTFEAPVTMRLLLGTDVAMHDSFLYRCRSTIYDVLKQRADREEAASPGLAGAYARELSGITFTPKGRPRSEERWLSDLRFVAAHATAPGVAEYTLLVTHHAAFDIVVDMIEKLRAVNRPMRLFSVAQQKAIDFAVGWPNAAAGQTPSFLDAARLTQRGHRNIAFVPNRGAGRMRYTVATFSVGGEGEVLRLIQPMLFSLNDGACIVHLVPPALTAPADTKPGDRKRKRDADDAILVKDRGQKRLTTFFVPQAKKARVDEDAPHS
jgi:hypothetical protein